MTSLISRISDMNPCFAAKSWMGERTLERAWAECERADWMLWLAAKAGVDRKLVVLAACACARTALKHVPEGEARPLKAIETAEAWTRGEATLEEVRRARDAAYAAYAAYAAAAADAYADAYAAAAADAYAAAAADAYAAAAAAAADAYADAYAADADADAYADAYAAAYAAAADATYAADAHAAAAYAADAYAAAAADAYSSIRAKTLKDLCPLVRQHIPVEVVESALASREKEAA